MYSSSSSSSSSSSPSFFFLSFINQKKIHARTTLIGVVPHSLPSSGDGTHSKYPLEAVLPLNLC